MTPIESLVPVPEQVAQRAWECARDIAAALGRPCPDQPPQTWIACQVLFRWHRVMWPARA